VKPLVDEQRQHEQTDDDGGHLASKSRLHVPRWQTILRHTPTGKIAVSKPSPAISAATKAISIVPKIELAMPPSATDFVKKSRFSAPMPIDENRSDDKEQHCHAGNGQYVTGSSLSRLRDGGAGSGLFNPE